MSHIKEAPKWDVYLHLPEIFGQWRMLEGCGVAAAEYRWSSKLRKEHLIQTVQMIFKPWGARLQLANYYAALSCGQLRINIRFSYRHTPSFQMTALCVMMRLSRIPSDLTLHWLLQYFNIKYCYNGYKQYNIKMYK